MPLTTISSIQKSQFLYPASQINGSGPITGIAFPLGGTPTTAEDYTVTIRLGHSTLTDLGTTFATNFSDTPVTVANTINLKVPADMAVGSDFWIPMPDGVFNYNGVDNLIVEIDVSSATGNTFWVVHAGGDKTRLLGPSGATIGSNLDTTRNDIKLRFNGGTMDVITDEGSATAVAFPPFAAGQMNLYRASELGTAATIHSVACRMPNATSRTSTFDNYKVIMGHTSLDTLDTTSSNNFVSQHVAYDGRLDIPAGLVRGDWITVNLTSPFAYDGTRNLVVWMGATSAPLGVTPECYKTFPDATRYPGQTGTAAPDAAIVSIQDSKFDMRLGISK